MATTRIRRVGGNPPAPPMEEEDRVYTEEDYAVKDDEWAQTSAYGVPSWTGEAYLPDEAFAPDEEEEDYIPLEAWTPAEYPPYAPMFEGEDDFTSMDDFAEDDFLPEELLTEEELAELRRSRWQLIAGLADFAGVILGTAAILVLVVLLVSLINWLVNDVSQSFILLQKNL